MIYFVMILLGILETPFARLGRIDFILVLLGSAIILYLIGVLIVTLGKRMKEIDEEDPDDLSKY